MGVQVVVCFGCVQLYVSDVPLVSPFLKHTHVMCLWCVCVCVCVCGVCVWCVCGVCGVWCVWCGPVCVWM